MTPTTTRRPIGVVSEIYEAFSRRDLDAVLSYCGAEFDLPECHIWAVRDGRVVEARFLIDSAGMLAALRT